MLKPPKVLMIDDDGDISRAAVLRLQAAGYRTLTASEGASGVILAAAGQPDLILLDVRMPIKDGITTLKELKRRGDTKHIPVVMLSASVFDQRAALEAGARFFLTKPYCANKLVQAVATALDCVR